MSILNYTTSISTEKTGSEIQRKLADAKAGAILFEYDSDGIMNSLSFRLNTQYGLVFFRLPSNRSGVLRALRSDKKVPSRLKTEEQAARVAWRITKDWVEAQLAIVEAGMAEMSEVFLPYAQGSDGRTMFQAIKSNGLQQLTGGVK